MRATLRWLVQELIVDVKFIINPRRRGRGRRATSLVPSLARRLKNINRGLFPFHCSDTTGTTCVSASPEVVYRNRREGRITIVPEESSYTTFGFTATLPVASVVRFWRTTAEQNDTTTSTAARGPQYYGLDGYGLKNTRHVFVVHRLFFSARAVIRRPPGAGIGNQILARGALFVRVGGRASVTDVSGILCHFFEINKQTKIVFQYAQN